MTVIMSKPAKQEVLNGMLKRLFVEGMELNSELNGIVERANEINQRLTEINNEMALLKTYGEEKGMEYAKTEISTQNIIIQTPDYIHTKEIASTTEYKKVERNKLSKSESKNCEDAVKEVLKQYGRPMKMGEIITELEHVGYKWSRYVSAYGFIRKLDCIEKSYHGYYQIRRN